LTGLFNLIFPFFGLIGLGYLAGRYFPREENGLVWLNRLIIYAALPALIFQIVRKAPVDQVLNIPFFLGTSLSTYLIFVITLTLMIVIYRAPLRQAAIQGSAASYGNIGYIGLPLTLSVFGPEAAIPAILVFCFDNTMQFVLVPLLMALGKEGPKDVVLILTRIGRLVFLHPFIIATILGVIFVITGIELPQPIDLFLGMLERAAGPCALFALGITISQQSKVQYKSEYTFLIGFKILLHPTLTFLILTFIGGFDPLWIGVATLMAALPTASNVFVMATDYRIYKTESSNCILISTVASLITISALLIAVDFKALPYGLFGN